MKGGRLMRIYATVTDLTAGAWVDSIPGSGPSPERLLRNASNRVAVAVERDIYEADSDGFPVDPKLREAMRDATCALVKQWITDGIDPDAGVAAVIDRLKVNPLVSSQSVDGGSVSLSVNHIADAEKKLLEIAAGTSQPTITEEAYLILRAAGLCRPFVVTA